MNDKVLVDTSIWIEYFRVGTGCADIVDELIDSNRAVIAGPIIAELIQGVKNTDEMETLSHCLQALSNEQLLSTDWVEAGKLSYILRKSGKTLPLMDILLATLALRCNMEILSKDSHFSLIPGIQLFHR